MLARLKTLLRPTRIATAAQFRYFISGESAVIAQKTAMGYCTAKAGTFTYALMTEKTFIDAMAICRWEAFAAVLADMLIVAETFLRPTSGAERSAVAQALADLYPSILGSHDKPPHRPQGWDDVIADFQARYAAAIAGPPVEPAAVATASGHRLFEVLPLHTNYRGADEQVILSSVTFQMVGIWEAMGNRVDRAALVRDLVASAAGPRPA